MATMSHEKSMQHKSRWEANEPFDTNNSTLQGYDFFLLLAHSLSFHPHSFSHNVINGYKKKNVELDVLVMETKDGFNEIFTTFRY